MMPVRAFLMALVLGLCHASEDLDVGGLPPASHSPASHTNTSQPSAGKREELVFYGHLFSGALGILQIITYGCYSHARKHPSSFVFWQSVCEVCFSCLGVAQHINFRISSNDVCAQAGPVMLFFLLCSLCWYFWMAVDLLMSMLRPFSFTENFIPAYHVLTVLSSGLLASVSVDAHMELRGDLGMCWPRDLNKALNGWTWACFYTPLFTTCLFSLGVLAFSCYWLLNHSISEGAMDFHRAHIKKMALYNGYYTLYWCVAGSLYVAINFQTTTTDSASDYIFPIVVASRGAMLSVTWCYNQGVIGGILASDTSDATDATQAKYSDITQALRSEVLPFLIKGIQDREKALESFQVCSKEETEPPLVRSESGLERLNGVSGRVLKFHAHKEEAFRRIRSSLNISLASLSPVKQEKCKDGGKTDAFMYFTDDAPGPSKYIFKTMTSTEKHVLEGLVEDYSQYLEAHPDSLLVKIVGCFTIDFESQSISFIMMCNILATHRKVHQLFDLKGSTVGRTVKDPSKSVLKDNNLRAQGTLHFQPDLRRAFLQQVEEDSQFLTDHNIMDYSLLLGISKSFVPVPPRAEVATKEGEGVFAHGIAAEKVEGPSFFVFGIVDVLQKWVWQKKAEKFIKTHVLRKSKTGLSSQEPPVYKERFCVEMQRYTMHMVEDDI